MATPQKTTRIYHDFRPAQLKENKRWYIEYYVINPQTNCLVRKTIKCNNIKQVSQRRKFARKIITELNNKLYSGWNPFIEEILPNGYHSFEIACEKFLKAKKKELRSNSIRSYESTIKSILEWLILTKRKDLYAVLFDDIVIDDFLFYLDDKKGISNTTYNNYLRQINVILNWMVEKRFIKENKAKKIKPRKKSKKTRVIIPAKQRKMIHDKLEQENKLFLGVCLLVFGSLIRPREISFLKPSHFDLERQIISLPPQITKNGNHRIATIPNNNINFFRNILKSCPNDNYIFGKHLTHSKNHQESRYFAKKWDSLVRKPFNFPMEYKLYSLRDSGIVQLLSNGVPIHEVMRLADHSSLEITTKYLPYANPTGSEIIKNLSSGF